MTRSQIDLTSKKVVVLGCARSATLYMAKVLKAEGMAVEHEFMGDDGSVSNYLVPRSLDMPPAPPNEPKFKNHSDGSRAGQYDFKEVFHQVRNPLKVMRSAAPVIRVGTDGLWMEPFIQRYDATYHHRMKPIQRMMRYWLYWNQMIEDLWPVTMGYRIEDIDTVWPEIRDRLDLPSMTPPAVSRTTHHGTGIYKAKTWTWADLDAADPILTDHIRTKARKYGYTDEELSDP